MAAVPYPSWAMTEFSTPLMRQYSGIKQRHPNALLLFRLGDFYELFFEDAVVAARELQITLTSRNKEKGVAIPMCGVPFHAAEGYIAKLIRKGFRVAICDQMEDPRLAKKLVKREVTRVVTPGTAVDSQVLEPRENNYLAAAAERDGWAFSDDYGSRLLRDHFRVATLAGYGLEGHPLAVAAAGAILHYVRETQRGSLAHFDGVRFYEQRDSLMLDPATLRNLELLEPVVGRDRASTLLAVLDQCVTSLGARLLKNWILRPSLNRQEIEARLEAVEVLSGDVIAREEFRRVLGKVQDLERLLSKVALETANARDLLALKQSIEHLPLIRKHVAHFPAPRLSELLAGLDELADVRERLEQSIHPEPPALLTEGGLIRRGYRADLDELRDVCQTSKQVIAGIEARERERTRIASLKVRFNQVFGYYIEVSKPNLPHVPADYERKQSVVNAERFTTAELKQLETRILEAEERSQTIEFELFREIRRQVAAEARRIRQTAQALAELDVLACFAHVAAERNYRRPEFSDDGELLIVQGRHPVIERISEQDPSGRFVPNDLSMNSASDRILIITGPNMGGKSTYLRQAALIALMAQMGRLAA